MSPSSRTPTHIAFQQNLTSELLAAASVVNDDVVVGSEVEMKEEKSENGDEPEGEVRSRQHCKIWIFVFLGSVSNKRLGDAYYLPNFFSIFRGTNIVGQFQCLYFL